MGFIYADGFITKRKAGSNVFGISLAEIEPLEKIKLSLNCDKRILYYQTSNNYSNCANEYKLAIINNKIVSDLEKHGVIENKTFKLKFPVLDSDDYYSHFIRGYFDGDGSVFYRKDCRGYNNHYLGVTICGMEDFLKCLQNKLDFINTNTIYKDNRRSTDCFSIKLLSNIRCINFYKYIYKDCENLFLTRKKKKFEDFFNFKNIILNN